jgi:hypothetical protein
MRKRLQQIVGIGVFMLMAGCATGAGFAADLPQARPLPMLHSLDDTSIPPEQRPPEDVLIPVFHPPDALIIAREHDSRQVRRLDAALVRVAPAPAVNWALLALVIAF